MGSVIHPKVLISNATRLHAHHHAYALEQAGLLQRFITSIWHKPNKLPYRLAGRLPGWLGGLARSFLAKRQHPGLSSALVEQRWVIELVRLAAEAITLHRLTDRILFIHKGLHDRIVARRVAALRPDVVIGYEISCARTFESARRIGAVTILDLAGLPHDFTAGIAGQHAAGLSSRRLESSLRARKVRELALADHILTISNLAREKVIEMGIAPDRVSVVRLGVSLQTFQPKTDYPQTGPFRILYVGNVTRAKGVDLLLEAFASLALPEAELVLVGSSTDRSFLERYEGQFTHIPFLEHARLAEEYRRADVLVLPTLYDSWGQVVAEAMACGTPVIVTSHCGAKELVSAENGWVVPAGDVRALATAIDTAFRGRHRLADQGRAARVAVEGLDWDGYHRAVAQRVRSIWEQARTRVAGPNTRVAPDAATR